MNSGSAPVTASITVTPHYTSSETTCDGPAKTFTITVNPTPTVNTVANRVHCLGNNGAAITFGGAVAGTTFAWTSTVNVGFGTSGSDVIPAYIAANNGGTPATAMVTVTPSANGCTGTPMTFNVIVNPTPTVSQPGNQSLCNGSMTSAVAFSGTATSFTWINNTPSIGLAASGTGNISQFSAINNGIAPVIATITVTPHYANGDVTCDGEAKTFTITVNPGAAVNSVSSRVHCAGDNGAGIDFSSVVSGTTFAWSSTENVGFGTGGLGNIPAYVAQNAGSAPIVAVVTVTPTSGTCAGAGTTFTVTVNPAPAVNHIDNQVVCNNASTAAINFSGTATSFSWVNSAPSIGLAASGTGNIGAFNAINTGNSPVIAVIQVTPHYFYAGVACDGPAQGFTITVNPTPSVTAIANRIHCAHDSALAINISGSVAGTTYNWTSTVNVGFGTSGAGNIGAYTAANSGTAPVTATVTVTPIANGCPGTPITFTVTVNPASSGPSGEGALGAFNSCSAPSSVAAFNATGISGYNVTSTWSLDVNSDGGVREFTDLALVSQGATITSSTGASKLEIDVKTFNGTGLPVGTHTVYLDIKGSCGTLSSSGTIVVADCDTFCSLTQGFYGNLKGKFLGVQGVELVKGLLHNHPLTVGEGDRAITITENDVNCLITRLPAGGPIDVIPSKSGGWNICDTTAANLFPQLDKKGLKFRNNMLGQTITLGLNLVLANDKQLFLGDYALGTGQICTAPATYNAAEEKWVTDFNACDCRDGISANVIAALALYGHQNVQGLFDLASRALGDGSQLYGTTLAELHAAVGLINEVFDECRTGGCTPVVHQP